eukprot:TRINITY_DN3335_c0_g3_i1.p1 TRINITY_DN3335_c0_g3~~TRINITY_DN3335_c0_g3_i1.p1  ORF type:complete len:137 (-),score=14.24 TRINITY_DN3335_c0_g3_i1:170-580(-)
MTLLTNVLTYPCLQILPISNTAIFLTNPLKTGWFFQQPVNNLLPHSITHLHVNGLFNSDISQLPLALTRLTLGKDFNTPIVTLPPSVKQVQFRDFGYSPPKFNHPVSHLTPNTVFQVFIFGFDEKVKVKPYEKKPY